MVQQLLQISNPPAGIIPHFAVFQLSLDGRNQIFQPVFILLHLKSFVCPESLFHVAFGVFRHIGNDDAAFYNVVNVLLVFEVHIKAHHLGAVDLDRESNVYQFRVRAGESFQQLLVFFAVQHILEKLHSFFPDGRLLRFAGRESLTQLFHGTAMPVAAQHVKVALGIVDVGPVFVVELQDPFPRASQAPALVLQTAWTGLHFRLCLGSKFRRRQPRFGGQQLVRVLDYRHHGGGQIPDGLQLIHRQMIQFLAAIQLILSIPFFLGPLQIVQLIQPAFQPPGLGVCLFGQLGAAAALPLHAAAQVGQHFRNAAVLPVFRHTVRAVGGVGAVLNLSPKGFQLFNCFIVIGGRIGQFCNLQRVPHQLRRHMVLFRRMQKHSVQLGAVCRNGTAQAVGAAGIAGPLYSILASGQRGAEFGVGFGPRLGLPFCPFTVCLGRRVYNPLRLLESRVPGLPFLGVQRIHHTVLHGYAVAVQVLVDPLPNHTRKSGVGNAFRHSPPDDPQGKIRFGFFVGFTIAVYPLGFDGLPHFCNAVQLLHAASNFSRKQTRVIPGQFLINLVNAPDLPLLGRGHRNAKPRQLFFGQRIAAIPVHQFLIFRAAALDADGKIMQVFVLVPQGFVNPTAALHDAVRDALCGRNGRIIVRIVAAHVIEQTLHLLGDCDFVRLALLSTEKVPGHFLDPLDGHPLGFRE